MATAQRTASASPALGLLVYDICCNANLGYEVGLYGSTDSNLYAVNVLSVIIYQRNDDAATGKSFGRQETFFSDHLVFDNYCNFYFS